MRLRVAAATVAAVLVLASACSDEPQLESDEVSTQIESSLSESYRLDVRVRSCPSKIAAEQGGSFRCTVEVDGQPFEVKVLQRDDRGNLSIEAQAAVVRTDRITEDLAGKLNAQFGRPFLVECGDPATKVVEPGARLQCRATDRMSHREVDVTVTDLEGSLSYEVRDPAGDPAPGPSTTPPSSTPRTLGTLVPVPSPTGPPP